MTGGWDPDGIDIVEDGTVTVQTVGVTAAARAFSRKRFCLPPGLRLKTIPDWQCAVCEQKNHRGNRSVTLYSTIYLPLILPGLN